MSNYLISRHSATIDWAGEQIGNAEVIAHLNPDLVVGIGDNVFGTLPVNIVAHVCAAGARYFHLCIDVPEEFRGNELNVDQLNELGATFKEYHLQPARQDS